MDRITIKGQYTPQHDNENGCQIGNRMFDPFKITDAEVKEDTFLRLLKAHNSTPSWFNILSHNYRDFLNARKRPEGNIPPDVIKMLNNIKGCERIKLELEEDLNQRCVAEMINLKDEENRTESEEIFIDLYNKLEDSKNDSDMFFSCKDKIVEIIEIIDKERIDDAESKAEAARIKAEEEENIKKTEEEHMKKVSEEFKSMIDEISLLDELNEVNQEIFDFNNKHILDTTLNMEISDMEKYLDMYKESKIIKTTDDENVDSVEKTTEDVADEKITKDVTDEKITKSKRGRRAKTDK